MCGFGKRYMIFLGPVETVSYTNVTLGRQQVMKTIVNITQLVKEMPSVSVQRACMYVCMYVCCDIYVGGKVRVSEFMISLDLQHCGSK